MRRLLILLCLLHLFSLAGCRGSQTSQPLAGPVVFVDAAGNRMVVDNRGEDPARSAKSTDEPLPAVLEGVPTKAFRGDDFMDSDDFMRELEQRESQRFYVIPDGIGGTQKVEARNFGGAALPDKDPVQADTNVAWRVCRLIVPLIPLKPARRLDVRFPAIDDAGVRHAGYRLAAPEKASAVRLDMYVRGGMHAQVLLARLDEKGRVLSIVNNMPTQTIPETVFRYASVAGRLALSELAGKDYALLDANLLRGRLPDSCGLPANGISGEGQVTVQFSGSERE